MGWIFRDGDTPVAKLITSALAIPIGLAILGLYNHHNVFTYAALKPWAAATGIAIGGGTCWALLKDRNPVSKFVHFGLLKRLAFLLCAFGMLGAMGFFAVWLGVPTMLSHFVLSRNTAEASVSQVLGKRSGRGCHYRIQIDGGPLPEAMTLCVPEELWKLARAKSTVAVTFTKNNLAFVIQDISLADSKRR